MIDCVFCKRILHREYDYKYSNLDTVQFEPLNPVVPGHMLFVPLVHVEEAAIMPPITGDVFQAAAMWAEFIHKPFNLITSAGSAATQTVKHLHVHYIPRRKDDGLHLPWTGQVK